MIFFNWGTMERVTKRDPDKIIQVLSHIMTFKKIPVSYTKNLWLFTNSWKGDSFLIHPEILLHNINERNKQYLSEYVELASYRGYIEYKLMRKYWLDYLPIYGEINNPLVTLHNNKIYFNFEGEN